MFYMSHTPEVLDRRTRIASEVRAEMARQKISKNDVAKEINVSLPTLTRRLSGDRPFYVDELDALSRLFRVPLSDLIERSEVEVAP